MTGVILLPIDAYKHHSEFMTWGTEDFKGVLSFGPGGGVGGPYSFLTARSGQKPPLIPQVVNGP